MSHVEAYTDVRITDLDLFAAACEELGLRFNRGATEYRWFNSFVGDSLHLPNSAVKFGIKPDGKCSHSASVVGNASAYELGLVEHPDGNGGYIPVFDSWGAHGGALTEKIGKHAEKLAQAYAKQAVYAQAKAGKYNVKSYETEDAVVYELTRAVY